MNYLENKEGIIFDLDGTLIDSMAIWENIGRVFLKNHGITPDDDLNEVIKTMTLKESSKYFIEEYKLDMSVEDVIKEIKQIIYNSYKYEIKLKKCVKEYLEKIKSQNMKMIVLTASEKELANICLERLDILDYFDFIITCSEVNMSKNNKEIFILASKKMNIKAENIIVFEDAFHCIKAAKSAGMMVIGVKDEYFSVYEKDIRTISDIYIESFCDIL